MLRHGDLSVLSFHATKVFNTGEGGAIICPDAKRKRHIDHLKNVGFVGETTVVASGINGKMNEMQAALGLLQLKHIDHALARRAEIAARYRKAIETLPGLACVPDAGQRTVNHAYFPILVGDDFPLSRDALYDRLKANGINGRRYFYPLISEFPMYRGLNGAPWLFTLPLANASQNLLIKDLRLADSITTWRRKWLTSLAHAYGKAPHHTEAKALIEPLIHNPSPWLIDWLDDSLRTLATALGLSTRFKRASSEPQPPAPDAQARILARCQHEVATLYVNPINGQRQYQAEAFSAQGIELRILHSRTPVYHQLSHAHSTRRHPWGRAGFGGFGDDLSES